MISGPIELVDRVCMCGCGGPKRCSCGEGGSCGGCLPCGDEGDEGDKGNEGVTK
ncbi:hypothetical protein BZA05DRAFT_448185 [Tricharina praecox]|uniref:uncharacterized protein n=1 Tax=Tricharina praecox TaxID=43433 RepID=UPI0022204153|nr:uncharacterized protein BZA05DRAFT_448185 [Tricharina praecox]KAI5844696.1 hypothetical protein BZA05DRAFT_448185 [Tricharina praecox]